jgi:ribonuclease HII
LLEYTFVAHIIKSEKLKTNFRQEKLVAFIEKFLKFNSKKQRYSGMKTNRSEHNRILALLSYERPIWMSGLQYIAGVDEAGRGPLAGPVVAAAVIFEPGVIIPGVDDSKKLSPSQREELFPLISARSQAIGIGIMDEQVIDQINILQATYRAMKEAISNLRVSPQHVLVDGRRIPNLSLPQTAIVGGDAKSYSIAAASIIAKVTRDRLMVAYDQQFPQYGFAQHKGYPTRKHIQAIIRHGYCPIHRTSFKIKEKPDFLKKPGF